MYKILLAVRADFMDIASEIPYLFKKAGCEVHVLCNEKSTMLSCSYYDKWVPSFEDDADFQKFLIELAQNNEYEWIVPVDDECNKVMNSFIDSEKLFQKILPITKIENRAVLSSKIGLSKACEKYGIESPRFVNFTELPDLQQIKQKLRFPVLLKEDFSFSGLGIQYCEDGDRLDACVEKVRVKENLVIQEFIKGEDIGVEALFKDGRLLTYNHAEIKNYMYNKFSFTTKRIYSKNQQIESLLTKLGESLGLNGFASIGYIYDPEKDTYYLIEADLRVNSWMPYGRFTGGDFIEGIKKYLNAAYTGVEKTLPHPKTEVAIFERDMRRCIRFRDFRGMAYWLFNIKGYWRFIPFYDLKLMRKIIKKMVYDLLKIKH